jgi:hypothetical protein
MDLERTLNQLDPPDWGPPPPDATGLITTCHAARQKPLRDLTPNDLRVLIGQNSSLATLIPLAIELLSENALTEAGLYPGDLLENLLKADPAFWRAHARLALEVDEIVRNLEWSVATLRDPIALFRDARLADPSEA